MNAASMTYGGSAGRGERGGSGHGSAGERWGVAPWSGSGGEAMRV